MASFSTADPRAGASRGCARTSCRHPATASLSFRYASSQVWLLDLSEHADPSLYDLCAAHADALTVPRGWERVDDRTAPPEPASSALASPGDAVATEATSAAAGAGVAGAGVAGTAEGAAGLGHRLHGAAAANAPADPRGPRAPHPPAHRPSRPPNRYAALSADLPRLAAQLAAAEPQPASVGASVGAASEEVAGAHASGAADASVADASGGDQAADPAAGGGGDGREEAAGLPKLPRDGEPRPPAPDTVEGERAAATPASADAPTDPEGFGPPPELDGQLALGVDVDGPGSAEPAREPVGAVVVPIGARRREPRDASASSGFDPSRFDSSPFDPSPFKS